MQDTSGERSDAVSEDSVSEDEETNEAERLEVR
jgi:hypothetical protein